MATTQIKDGFDGGSDNQLKVNTDGSINTNSTSVGTSDVNVVSSVLPTGASTSANQATINSSIQALQVAQGSTTSGESGPLVQGAVTSSTPSYTDGKTDPLSLTTSGALRTDSSATTQPISGTVTTNLVQTSFFTGSKSSIGTSAVQIITSSTPVKVGVTVKAADNNTGTVYIGNSTVTAGTTDATDGFELAGGESVTIEINDVNKVYAISSTTGQKVYWTAD